MHSELPQDHPQASLPTPEAGIDPLAAAKRGKAIALGVFLGSSAIFGIADVVLWQYKNRETTGTILDTIIGILSILVWCSYDARVRNFPLSGGLRLFILLVAVIGVPVYLVKSRGWIASAKIGFGLPAFLLSVALGVGASLAAEWIADQFGYFS